MPRIFLRVIEEETGMCIDMIGTIPELVLHEERQPPPSFSDPFLKFSQVLPPRWWTDIHVDIDKYFVSIPEAPVRWEGESEVIDTPASTELGEPILKRLGPGKP